MLTRVKVALIATIAAPTLSCGVPESSRVSALPLKKPALIRPFQVDDRFPWRTGAYGAVGGDLYWFYRVDPRAMDRRGGTLGYDNASTSEWTFARVQHGQVVPLASFHSRFAGAVLMSQLRCAPSGDLYVAITGNDASDITGELVRLSPSGSARLVWSGVLDDWPEIAFSGEEVVVDSTWRYVRMSEAGQVREMRKTDYHTSACVQDGRVLINAERHLTSVGGGKTPHFAGWPRLGERDLICQSMSAGIAVLTKGTFGDFFVSERGTHVQRVTLSPNLWWDIQSQGDGAAIYVHGDANTLLLENSDGIVRVLLPDAVRGFRIPPGTTTGQLFLLTGDGYYEVRQERPADAGVRPIAPG